MYVIEAFHYSKDIYLIEAFFNDIFNCNGKMFSTDKSVYHF